MALKLLTVLALLVACGIVYAQEDDCARLCQTDKLGLSSAKSVARGLKHRASRTKGHVAPASRQAADVEDYCATYCAGANRRKQTTGGSSRQSSSGFDPISIAESFADIPAEFLGLGSGSGSSGSGSGLLGAFSNIPPFSFFLGGGSSNSNDSSSGSGGGSDSGSGLLNAFNPLQYISPFLGGGSRSTLNPSNVYGSSSGGQSGSGQSSGSGTQSNRQFGSFGSGSIGGMNLGIPTSLNSACNEFCSVVTGSTGRKGNKERHSRQSALPQPVAGQQTRQQFSSGSFDCSICNDLPNFSFGGTS